MKNKTVILGIAGIALAGLAYSKLGPLGSTPTPAGSASQPAFNQDLVKFGPSMEYEAFNGMNLTRSFNFRVGGSDIEFISHERRDQQSSWEKTTLTQSTELTLYGIAPCMEGGVYIVCGTREVNGIPETVLQLWTLPSPDGAWEWTTSQQVPAIGSPAPLPFAGSGSTVVAGGGTYTPPSQRFRRTLAPQRETLWVGPGWGDVRSVGADPEGRYALLQRHDNGSLFALDLTQTGSAPVFLADDSVAQGISITNAMAFYDHATLGRIIHFRHVQGGWLLEPSSPVVCAIDNENDGVINSWGFATEETFEQTPWGDFDDLNVPTISPAVATHFGW